METGTAVREQDEAVIAMRDAVENLVVGGGPAGSMAAMRLAAAGRDVALFEKERAAHDKVCGEFLSREAIAYLRQAGIDPREFGAAAITWVRLSSGERSVDAELPFTALSLSRRVLDEMLLNRAKEAGCEILRGAFVDRLRKHDSGWTIRLRDGHQFEGKNVFLATGKHDVSAWTRPGGSQADLIGFKMHWQLSSAQIEALRGVMELFLFRGGYGGLSLVENEIANLCFVIRRSRLQKLGGWTGLVPAMCEELPLLSERLQGALPWWGKPLAISPIPYGYVARNSNHFWRIGDQAAVIPSFTGDGMSIALHSAFLAAEMFLAGKSADAYLGLLAQHIRNSMRTASFLSRGMVTTCGRLIAPSLLSLFPGAMQKIATLTRIPDDALAAAAFDEKKARGSHPLPIA